MNEIKMNENIQLLKALILSLTQNLINV